MAHFTEKDLEKLGLKDNGDGTFSKKKTTPQPREYKTEMTIQRKLEVTGGVSDYKMKFDKENSQFNLVPVERSVSLKLFGIPMPKQSVRGYATGKRNTKTGSLIVDHFQPQKTVDRTKDYIYQIKEQLPVDFKMFEHEVRVTKMHFVYPPPKYFHKIKGRMDAIRNGEIIYKNTRPDLPDNLKKLVNDAMSGLVYKDDGIIVTENDVAKYYGTGGCVIIELKGY